MEEKDLARERKIKEKATFYFSEKIKAHILIIPDGFRNGFFKSDLNSNFYWFEELDGKQIRLFLSEIYDIEDYKARDELK